MVEELSPKASEIAAYTRLLLASGGYNSFSYADISDVVKISKASIHHHFPSKAELVRSVVANYRTEARQGMAAMDQHMNDPIAEMKAYTDYWATCIHDGTSPFCICVMLAAEMTILPEEIAREVRGHFEDLTQWLSGLLEKGQNNGSFRLTDTPDNEARAFMATVHGAMLSARAFGEATVFDQIIHPLMHKFTATM